MNHTRAQEIITEFWPRRDTIVNEETNDVRAAVDEVLNGLDKGTLRVAEPLSDGEWVTHQWLKQAILLSFRLKPTLIFENGPFMEGRTGAYRWYDKVALKMNDWHESDFERGGFRAVPGAIVRHGAFIGKNVVLMPSFVNIGAYVGANTMIDTWATVGSCVQIGQNCHISGGAGIGGVLEPLQANPTIIEDDCFIGARSEIAEGVVVERGAVLSMGVFIGASTKIIDRATGAIYTGRVPAFSVVVPGSLPTGNGVNLACAVIVKTVDAQTRSKTAINEILRSVPQ